MSGRGPRWAGCRSWHRGDTHTSAACKRAYCRVSHGPGRRRGEYVADERQSAEGGDASVARNQVLGGSAVSASLSGSQSLRGGLFSSTLNSCAAVGMTTDAQHNSGASLPIAQADTDSRRPPRAALAAHGTRSSGGGRSYVYPSWTPWGSAAARRYKYRVAALHGDRGCGGQFRDVWFGWIGLGWLGMGGRGFSAV